jgi:hypothetical protein
VQFLRGGPRRGIGRQHGTGRIYVKHGSYYGRWRTPAGRDVNRRLGEVRGRGNDEGLSRREADHCYAG